MKTIIRNLITIFVGITIISCTDSYKENNENIYKSNGVKKITQIRHDYKFGEADMENGYINLIEEYNQDGLITRKSLMYDSDIMKKYETHIFYSYNLNNKVDSIIVLNFENGVKSKTHYKYSDNKEIGTIYDASGDIKYKFIHELDSKGRTISEIKYNSQGELESKTINKYDNIGLKSASQYNHRGELEEIKKRINNNKNDLQFELIDNAGVIKEKEQHIRDKNARNIEFKHQTLDTNHPYTYHSKTSYFDNGLVRENITFNEIGDPESLTIYEYEFW